MVRISDEKKLYICEMLEKGCTYQQIKTDLHVAGSTISAVKKEFYKEDDAVAITKDELDKLLRRITVAVYQKHHVVLTAIGVYSTNTRDPEAIEAREKVKEAALQNEYVLQVHGFYLDKAEQTIRFDMVISFDAPDRTVVYKEVCERIQKIYPDYRLQIAMDTDFSE